MQRPDAEVIDLSPADVADGRFVEAVGGSLFASASIVIVRDLTVLPPEQHDLVVRTASHPGDDLCLTLTHPGGVKGKALVDQLVKAGVKKITVEAPKAWKLPDFVKEEGKRVNVGFDPPAAAALVDAVGNDLSALAGAVAQLASDWPDARMSVDMVNRYFAGKAEVSGFAIGDAVMNGHSQEALSLLRWGFDTGTPPVLITSALASSLRALGKYMGLRAARLSETDLARAIGVPPWKVKDVAAQARAWTPNGVARGIAAVAKADAEVKGASADPEFALESLVLTLSQIRSGVT